MKTSIITSYSFKGEHTTKNNKPYIKYPVSALLGAGTGALIPLKMIDGPDAISNVTHERKIILMKTEVPNILGKWKLALVGAFLGIIGMSLHDYIKSKKSTNQ